MTKFGIVIQICDVFQKQLCMHKLGTAQQSVQHFVLQICQIQGVEREQSEVSLVL
jgi:hypothetical protein